MRVLLIFKSVSQPGVGIRVVDCPKLLSECVVSLLEKNKGKEAFELLKRQATQEALVPSGYQFEKYTPALNESDMN
jgi:hypothetical protein